MFRSDIKICKNAPKSEIIGKIKIGKTYPGAMLFLLIRAYTDIKRQNKRIKAPL